MTLLLDFSYMGKSIDKRLAELSATRFYDMGCADEALGLEDSVEPWLDGLWEAFFKSVGVKQSGLLINAGEEDSNKASSVEKHDTTPSKLKETEHVLPAVAANLITYEKMFGSESTCIPQDVPRFQDALFKIRFEGKKTDSSLEKVMNDGASSQEPASPSRPFLAPILQAKYLTSDNSERKVLYLEIDIEGSNIEYNPGDSIGIKCPNRTLDVNLLLERLELQGDDLFYIEANMAATKSRRSANGVADRFPSPCSVRDAFLYHVDILSVPKKAVLRALATYCTDLEEQARMLTLSSKSGASKYKEFIEDQQLNVLELLFIFPSCKPPFDHLLSLLPQLMPRYYSVASSPLANPNRLSIALTIVQNELILKNGSVSIKRPGLCSNWLKEIVQPLLTGTSNSMVKIPIFLRPTRDFLLPASHRWPLILIGPGTGVAPFMGFLQHRFMECKKLVDEASDVCSGCWRGGIELDLTEDEEFTAETKRSVKESKGIYLFFGCRKRNEDWIFREQMEMYTQKGTLTKLSTAFSREQNEKYYVQHEIKKNAKLVADLILYNEAYVYVCGDGTQMAKDVHLALISVLEEAGNLTKEQAEEQMKTLATRQRYIRDIWC
jgi:sulfite reductase alpha subunit-like flavoprotein